MVFEAFEKRVCLDADWELLYKIPDSGVSDQFLPDINGAGQIAFFDPRRYPDSALPGFQPLKVLVGTNPNDMTELDTGGMRQMLRISRWGDRSGPFRGVLPPSFADNGQLAVLGHVNVSGKAEQRLLVIDTIRKQDIAVLDTGTFSGFAKISEFHATNSGAVFLGEKIDGKAGIYKLMSSSSSRVATIFERQGIFDKLSDLKGGDSNFFQYLVRYEGLILKVMEEGGVSIIDGTRSEGSSVSVSVSDRISLGSSSTISLVHYLSNPSITNMPEGVDTTIKVRVRTSPVSASEGSFTAYDTVIVLPLNQRVDLPLQVFGNQTRDASSKYFRVDVTLEDYDELRWLNTNFAGSSTPKQATRWVQIGDYIGGGAPWAVVNVSQSWNGVWVSEKYGEDVTLNLELQGNVQRDFTLPLSISYQLTSITAEYGKDFEATGSSLTFTQDESGVFRGTIPIVIKADLFNEEIESFFIWFSAANVFWEPAVIQIYGRSSPESHSFGRSWLNYSLDHAGNILVDFFRVGDSESRTDSYDIVLFEPVNSAYRQTLLNRIKFDFGSGVVHLNSQILDKNTFVMTRNLTLWSRGVEKPLIDQNIVGDLRIESLEEIKAKNAFQTLQAHLSVSSNGRMAVAADSMKDSTGKSWRGVFVSRPMGSGKAVKFLTVITHGWDPQASEDPVSKPWTTTYKSIVSNYGSDSVAPGSHQVEANVWDSSSGWNNAKEAVVEYLKSPLYYDIELPALIQYVETQMALARKNATLSAWTIKQIVSREVAKDNQVRVHLIGHSRGGAVSALASRMLAPITKVEQLTVLDGYSTDWPGIWGILGDADLEKQAFADRKVNFLVELSLPGSNAKAPNRLTFDRNTVVEGYAPYAGLLGLSTHVTVSDLYFHSYLDSDSGVYRKEDYLADSPIGRWILENDGTSGSGEGPTTLLGSEMASVTGFSDGDFEDSWRSQQFVDDILALDASTDAALANYQEYLREESHQKVAGWLSSGQVSLVASGAGGAAELTATTSTPASISQPVYLPAGANRIRFSLNDLSPTQAGTIRVSLDNEVLLQQAISPGNLEVIVPLPNQAGSMCQIKIEILSNGPGAKRTEIDDIRMEIPLAIDSIESTPVYLGESDVIQIKATSTAPFSEVGGKIRFYMEYNDLSGLQPDGDRFLGEVQAASGDSDWTITIPKSEFPFKGVYSILAYAQSGSAVGPVRELQFWVENSDSPLTNKQLVLDVNRDASVSPLDALIIINFINSTGSGKLRPNMLPIAWAIDVNDDGFVSPLDALAVINHINSRVSGGEGESSITGSRFSRKHQAGVSAGFDENDGFESAESVQRRFAFESSIGRKKLKMKPAN